MEAPLTEEQLQKYLKGTTTLGFVCKDGVVLGSDTRSTMGFFIADKEAQKIYAVDDKMAITTAGLVGDNQALVRLMKAQIALYKLQGKSMSVRAAATILANILHSRRYSPFWVQLLVGGIDTEGRIFELDPVGGLSEKVLASTGSGSPTAYGVLEQSYKGKEKMTVEEGIKLAARAIKGAQERDAATGNKIEIVTITDKGYRKIQHEQVLKLLGE